MRNIFLVFTFLISLSNFAQELKCEVVVNAQQTGNETVQVFKTLERQLNEFINNTQWTGKNVLATERIECSMVLNITNYDSDLFEASIQVRSSRPVFNSTYSSPVYNFNDRDFNFRYLEFQNLNFSPTQFESNLVSVLAFHVYMILGLDGDTFELNGGQEYFDMARTIVGYSQQNNSKGWEPPKGGDQTRSQIIDNVMSPTYREFRTVLYEYHRTGLDLMHNNIKQGKENIADAVSQFLDMNQRRPNSFVLRTFFDAKAEEIEDIYSDGPSVNVADFVDILNKVAPMHSSKWRNISY